MPVNSFRTSTTLTDRRKAPTPTGKTRVDIVEAQTTRSIRILGLKLDFKQEATGHVASPTAATPRGDAKSDDITTVRPQRAGRTSSAPHSVAFGCCVRSCFGSVLGRPSVQLPRAMGQASGMEAASPVVSPCRFPNALRSGREAGYVAGVRILFLLANQIALRTRTFRRSTAVLSRGRAAAVPTDKVVSLCLCLERTGCCFCAPLSSPRMLCEPRMILG